MTNIPEDVLALAKAAFDEMDQIPYDDFYEEQAERVFARAILAERKRNEEQISCLVQASLISDELHAAKDAELAALKEQAPGIRYGREWVTHG